MRNLLSKSDAGCHDLDWSESSNPGITSLRDGWAEAATAYGRFESRRPFFRSVLSCVCPSVNSGWSYRSPGHQIDGGSLAEFRPAQHNKTTPLERISTNLRTVLSAHVALQLVDRRCLRSPDDIERNGLMGVAAETADPKVAVPGIQGIADGR